MLNLLLVAFLAVGHQEPNVPPPADRIKELAGRWEFLGAQATQEQQIIPATLLGLTEQGTEVTVEGNQLLSGGKVLATLTTDFSDSGLNLDRTVFFNRCPVLLTFPSGKGLLCAYEYHAGRGFTVYYPHRMGRVDRGTRLYFGPAKK